MLREGFKDILSTSIHFHPRSFPSLFSRTIKLSQRQYFDARVSSHHVLGFFPMDPATAKFLAARPYAVLPISPPLAALYSTHSSCIEKNTQWCSRCGSYLLNGGSHVRIVRPKLRKGKPFKRVIRTVCQSCQHPVDVTVESGGNLIDSSISTSLQSSSTSSPSIPPSPLLDLLSSGQEAPAKGKARPKKKSGLQLLLSKARRKEMQERQSNLTSESLATFLAGL